MPSVKAQFHNREEAKIIAPVDLRFRQEREPELPEKLPVFLDVVTPFRWNIEFVKNRVDRADRHTVRAVNTGGRINEILLYRIGCRDTINRADFHTGSIFNPGTRFCYYVGHSNLLA